MSGYMIAEVWCDLCGDKEVAEDEGTLRDHRADLREAGWKRRFATNADYQAGRDVMHVGQLVDVCPECADD